MVSFIWPYRSNRGYPQLPLNHAGSNAECSAAALIWAQTAPGPHSNNEGAKRKGRMRERAHLFPMGTSAATIVGRLARTDCSRVGQREAPVERPMAGESM